MRRFTVSIEDNLADKFDALARQRGYENRSEAFRDLIRRKLGERRLTVGTAKYCVANPSYIYNHHERRLAERLTSLRHAHHEVAVASLHAHLDHQNCIESIILQGPTAAVTKFAELLMAEKGVRHGQIDLVPVEVQASYLKPKQHIHRHPDN